MNKTLTSFIASLRNAEVRTSPAETLDAMNAVELTGYRDREFLKNTLALVLPKTADEKETYENTFERFFSFREIRGEDSDTQNESSDDGDATEDQGQGDGAGGSAGQTTANQTGKKSKYRFSPVETQAEVEDVGTGEMSDPTSHLGTLLMKDWRIELSVGMADAAKVVKLEDIQVFTQKGLYTRRILEQMGLHELLQEIKTKKQSFRIQDRRLSQELKHRQDWLREQVRDYVEKQFLLHADANGFRLREELLRKVKLSNVEQRNFRLVQEVVFRMAKRLVTLHSRRKKFSNVAR